jgi:hypothetical protein
MKPPAALTPCLQTPDFPQDDLLVFGTLLSSTLLEDLLPYCGFFDIIACLPIQQNRNASQDISTNV